MGHDPEKIDPQLALSQAKDIDFSTLQLGYESFRQLSQNPNLSPEEKIAFPVSYRRGFEDVILEDIRFKVDLLDGEDKVVVDIGCGVGGLTERLVQFCLNRAHKVVLVDSAEMLAQAPGGERVLRAPGMYPNNAAQVREVSGGADVVISYSVLHYAFVDTNLFRFLDAIVELLNPGGMALIGDIPNVSKRKRFFASPAGIAYHKSFMNTDAPPVVRHFAVERDTIDDAVLSGLVARAQAAGCHAYVVPQDRRLPMSNRRDDLLIQKP
jgi:SAM-dependent methyltransferase